MKFTLLRGLFAICKANSDSAMPDWASIDGFCSVTRTADELTVICEEAAVPHHVQAERGFICMKLQGPFDFQAIGILESFLGPLANAGVPIFAISTFATDYILVRQEFWGEAFNCLQRAGHELVP
jgi:hypothetical protein